MDTAEYLSALHREAAAFVAAASLATAAPAPAVPSCPGWSMTDLVLHLGAVYRHAVRIVANRQREEVPLSRDDLGWLRLGQHYIAWLVQGAAPSDVPLPTEVLAWCEQSAAELEAVLRAADPDEPIWTWAQDRRVAHYPRMMAIETAIHRWDAQLAQDDPAPIEATLAVDGIDQTFDVMLPARRQWREPRPSAGESYHFHRSDGPGEWVVRFEPAGVVITREHAKGDVAARGTASDLFLFLWHRIPAARLDVFGDASLLDRYFELVPPV